MDNTIRKYRYWEWRTIAVLFIGYALFYFVRKNLGMAIPAMEAELGISKTQLGIFLTLHSIIYGFSRFVNGMLVDRFSKRKIMKGWKESSSVERLKEKVILGNCQHHEPAHARHVLQTLGKFHYRMSIVHSF